LALLQAVGFRRRSLRWLVLSEHAGLLLIGLAIGLVAALIAVAPALASRSSDAPLISLGLTIGGVFLTGLLWTWLAVAAALRGDLLRALRNE
jgi:ABC-type antimicrobial peptide transport system permease subunit